MELAITSTSMKLRERAPVVLRGEDSWCFEQIQKIGYDGVELHIHDSDQIDRKLLKQELDKYGLSLTSIGTGSAYGKDHVFLSSEDEDTRKAAIDRLKGHILTASDYPHAVVIIGLIKGKVSDCRDRETYFKYLIPSLQECAKEAEKYQVYLGIELINRYESDVINTIEEGMELLDQVGSPWLQLHLDTYHMNIEESDISQAIHTAQGKICHVHVADNDRWYVGHGHYDFTETLIALKDIGYTGAICVESLGFPDMISSAKASYENMKRIMGKI